VAERTPSEPAPTSSPAAKEVAQLMPVQRFAQVFGAVYVLVGLLGFAFTGFANFAGTSEDKLLLFGVNPLHNIVHLAVGALWLASSRSEASARAALGLYFGLAGRRTVASAA
jgi:Domain of unknown function (DUF4383)